MEHNKPIKLTPDELECIIHRLACSDAIADVIYETFYTVEDGDGEEMRESINRVCHNLWRTVEDSSALPCGLTELEMEILKDSIEGSTFLSTVDTFARFKIEDEKEAKKYTKKWRAVMKSTAKKVARAIGVDELARVQSH